MLAEGHVSPHFRGNKETFGELLEEAYAVACPGAKLEHYAVAEERHKEGTEKQRHYHMHACVKAEVCHRFMGVVNYLRRKNVFVHASTSHSNYATAFRYLVLPSRKKTRGELDLGILLSDDHPEKSVAATLPATSSATSSVRSPDQLTPAKKTEPDSKRVVAHEVIVQLGIKHVDDYEEFARSESLAGRKRHLEFFHTCRDLDAFITKVWEFEESPLRKTRKAKGRITILEEARDGVCFGEASPCICGGRWMPLALDTLRKNYIDVGNLCRKVIVMVRDGPQKGNIVFFWGPTTCAKSWLLDPLRKIFYVMSKPEEGTSYSLSDLPSFEVCLWHEADISENRKESCIGWRDALNWFDGKGIRVGRSKSFFAKDVEYVPIQPLFITNEHLPHHSRRDQVKMMHRRIDGTQFVYEIPEGERAQCPDCPKCFAEFMLTHGGPL
jgi:hypothetical protein